jgi:alpha-tubulin suppressor-like RCC1 family protein
VPPHAIAVTAIASGGAHTVARCGEGVVVSWGSRAACGATPVSASDTRPVERPRRGPQSIR